jgi:beta-phosphoglucomutase
MVEGVIFDMDGVLVDSGPAHQASWQHVASKHGVDVSPDRFRQTFGLPSRDIIRIIWGDKVSDDEVARLDEEKESIYRDLIRDHIPLMAGCREMLERLRRAGLLLAVASSGSPENLDMVISDGLIANHFQAQVHGFDVAAGKPAPDCFLLAAERLGLPPEKCVAVEDAPVGITAGHAAKMRVIALVGTHPAERLSSAGADRVVPTLDEITPEMIRAL